MNVNCDGITKNDEREREREMENKWSKAMNRDGSLVECVKMMMFFFG